MKRENLAIWIFFEINHKARVLTGIGFVFCSFETNAINLYKHLCWTYDDKYTNIWVNKCYLRIKKKEKKN